MKSVALDHFPRVVAVSGRFWLYNPVLKKRYENRPEERVRLKWVEYILHRTKWRKTKIGFETPVKIRQSKNTLRADLILYSESFIPEVLVECKADSVKLSRSAAVQAARYNKKLNAPYIVLTNGLEDYWFEQKNGEIHPQENNFGEQMISVNPERDFEYWQQRGFCSGSAGQIFKNWIPAALDSFWSAENTGKQLYLDFRESILPVPMNHYYKVFDIESNRRLAISFIGCESSDNYIVGVLNSGGVNQAVLAVNLNLVRKGEDKSILIFRENKSKTVVSGRELPVKLSDFDPCQIKNLPEYLMNFFD